MVVAWLLVLIFTILAAWHQSMLPTLTLASTLIAGAVIIARILINANRKSCTKEWQLVVEKERAESALVASAFRSMTVNLQPNDALRLKGYIEYLYHRGRSQDDELILTVLLGNHIPQTIIVVAAEILTNIRRQVEEEEFRYRRECLDQLKELEEHILDRFEGLRTRTREIEKMFRHLSGPEPIQYL